MGQVLPHAYALVGNLASGLPGHAQAFCLAQPLTLSADSNVGEMQLAMVGRWHHPEYGEFEITEADIDSCLAVFAEQRTPAMFDWNHASTIKGATAEQGKASGWIKSLTKRVVDGVAQLWADTVEWTDEAADKIRKREYQFSSPVLLRNVEDRASGKPIRMRLFNAALTNTPFLDGMAAAKLSEVSTDEEPAKDEPASEGDAPPAKPAPDAPPADAEATEAEEPEADELDEQSPAEGDAPEPGTQANNDGAGMGHDVAIAALDGLAKAVDVDLAKVADVLTRHADGFAKAVREILDREQVAASNQTTQVSMSEQTPSADAEKRFAALEAQQGERDVIALNERITSLEAENKRRAEAEAASNKLAIEAKVDGLIKDGFVHAKARNEAIWAFTENPERAAKLFRVKHVPIGESQAGDTDREPGKQQPGAALKLSDVTDPDIKRSAQTIMGLTKLDGTGKKFTEAEAIEKATTNILQFRGTARKVG